MSEDERIEKVNRDKLRELAGENLAYPNYLIGEAQVNIELSKNKDTPDIHRRKVRGLAYLTMCLNMAVDLANEVDALHARATAALTRLHNMEAMLEGANIYTADGDVNEGLLALRDAAWDEVHSAIAELEGTNDEG